jgi:GH35 family endo-1,4-beta-xylanase
MADWYKLVHQLDPHPVLCLNEYSILSAGGLDQAHQAALEKIVKDLQAAGAPLQALGLQSHMGMNATPPERVLQVLDRFAKLGLPMEITEFDIPGADEQLQADYTRDFLIATFSHPQVVGFTMWGFWEGRHWRGDSAMFRRDFSPKPSATVWHELVYKDWWTNQTVPTDAQGAAALRGFLGDYDVTVTRGGQTATATATLAKGGTRVQVVMK